MKTIRHSTFETNSSSTHAFTIKSKKSVEAFADIQLVYAGVLYPNRLKHSSGFTDAIGDGGWTINCVSMYEKLAHFLLHLRNIATCDWYDYDLPEGRAFLALEHVISKTINEHYLKVAWGERDDDRFTSITEDGSYLIDLLMREDWAFAIDKHMQEVIHNDDAITCESELDW